MDKSPKNFLTGMVLFAGAFVFALHFINEGLFHIDSLMLAKAVEDIYRGEHLHWAYGVRLGALIVNAALYFPFHLLGRNADFVTRFSSVLFYALSITAFFVFIKDLFHDGIQGVFAAVLLALTPFYLVPNTYGKEHGMGMFFFLCSMILVNRGSREHRSSYLIWAGMFYMASLSVRESVLIMLPFYGWLYLQPSITGHPFKINIPKEKLHSRLLYAFALPTGGLLGFMLAVYLGPLLQRSFIGDELFVPHFCGFFSSTLPIAFSDAWRSFPALFFMLCIMGGLIVWQSRRYFLLLFFLVWACLVFIYGNFDSYVARHLDMAVLSLHAFASCFLAWLYRRFRIGSIFIFIVLIAVQLIRIYPMLEFRRQYDATLRLAVFLNTLSRPDAVFLAGDEKLFIEYYAKRRVIGYPIGCWEKMDGIIHDIDTLMKAGHAVYVIPMAPLYSFGGTIAKTEFLKAGPHAGGILNRLIQEKVVRQISAAQVSFQLNDDRKQNAIRKIAKSDFPKIMAVFWAHTGYCKRKIWEHFNVSFEGDVIYEGYYRPELGLDLYRLPVYRLWAPHQCPQARQIKDVKDFFLW